MLENRTKENLEMAVLYLSGRLSNLYTFINNFNLNEIKKMKENKNFIESVLSAGEFYRNECEIQGKSLEDIEKHFSK